MIAADGESVPTSLSLIEKIQEAHKHSTNSLAFLRELGDILLSTSKLVKEWIDIYSCHSDVCVCVFVCACICVAPIVTVGCMILLIVFFVFVPLTILVFGELPMFYILSGGGNGWIQAQSFSPEPHHIYHMLDIYTHA